MPKVQRLPRVNLLRLRKPYRIMNSNNWRPIQAGEPHTETIDWRTQLQPESRQRIVNKIMDTLNKHLLFSGEEGLNELKKIAERFEEKIYAAATSQSDYLRKISLKMLTMEIKSKNTIPNSLPANPAATSRTAPDPELRQRIVNKIMDTLNKHLLFSGEEGLNELKKIAERFEEKIYTVATSQSDYLRKISLKMLTIETKSENTIPNSLPANPAATSRTAPDPEQD